jgi:hypothetical protein
VEVENDAVSTNEAGIIASCSGSIAVWFAFYDNNKKIKKKMREKKKL